METKRLEVVIFFGLFVCLSALIFFIFKPFLGIIVLAAVLSVLFYPLYQKLLKIFHGGRSLIALLIVIVSLIFVIIPILFLGLQIFNQAHNFFSLTQFNQGQYIRVVQQSIDTLTSRIAPNLSFSITDSIDNVLTFIASNLGVLISQTAYIFFQIFFLLFALFFFLRDGEKMLNSFISLSPFEKKQNEQIVNSIYRTINSVIKGTLFVGLVRFVLFGGVFYLFGIPNALLWASIGGIVGAIPGLGTPFVIGPAFLYLWFTGNIFAAVGLGLFGILIVFFVDNWMTAYFFGKGLEVSSIFILFSILGGIIFFGPLGFIFGPIILSLFVLVVDMYKILVLKRSCGKESLNLLTLLVTGIRVY